MFYIQTCQHVFSVIMTITFFSWHEERVCAIWLNSHLEQKCSEMCASLSQESFHTGKPLAIWPGGIYNPPPPWNSKVVSSLALGNLQSPFIGMLRSHLDPTNTKYNLTPRRNICTSFTEIGSSLPAGHQHPTLTQQTLQIYLKVFSIYP